MRQFTRDDLSKKAGPDNLLGLWGVKKGLGLRRTYIHELTCLLI